MKSILSKGMNYSFKSNLSLHKAIINKLQNKNSNTHHNINLNKIRIKPKLLLPKKNSVIQNILIPLSLEYKKYVVNSGDKNSSHCYTEANIDSKNNNTNVNNEKNFKKLNILPKIKENNIDNYHSKKNIYLGSYKFSLNLNTGSTLSCRKIFVDKNNNNKSKEMNENSNVNVKKIFLKELIINKNKSEKRRRNFEFRIMMKKNNNALIKPKKKMDMNDIIINNDFHGNKIIDLYGSLKKGIKKLNNFMKYQQIKTMNKRKINYNNELNNSKTFNKIKQNENEKSESRENTINNNISDNNNKCILLNSYIKGKHFKSVDLIKKINSSKKISKTLSNDSNNNINNTNNIKENKKNNLQIINGEKYFQKKIRNKNEDIINLLENTNN